MNSIEASFSAGSCCIRLLALAVLAMGLAACGGGEDATVVCTAEARPAVDLQVVDGAGVLLSNVTVSYRVDGGASQTLVCDTVLPCALGYELAGTYAITAAKAGYSSASATVTVARDVCHVITERRTLTLQPAT